MLLILWLFLLLFFVSSADGEETVNDAFPAFRSPGHDAPELAENLSELLASGRFGGAYFAGNVIPMLLIDPESGLIMAGNEAAKAFYGYRKLHGKHIDLIDTITPEDVRNTTRLRRNRFDFRYSPADGSTRDACVYFYPVPFNPGFPDTPNE